MARTDVVRAWKDPAYRASLQADEFALVPSHPAGLVSVSDDELKDASGIGRTVETTAWFCTLYTFLARCCPGG
jgi:mersacidin/lichenicidin family type 2 lantibiotic